MTSKLDYPKRLAALKRLLRPVVEWLLLIALALSWVWMLLSFATGRVIGIDQ